MKSRPLLVGIFDDDRNLDRAVERLAAEGFEDTVFDEATVSEGPANSGPTPVGPVLVAGAVPVQAVGKRDLSRATRSFRSRLADYDLPETEVPRRTPGSSSAARSLFWSRLIPSE